MLARGAPVVVCVAHDWNGAPRYELTWLAPMGPGAVPRVLFDSSARGAWPWRWEDLAPADKFHRAVLSS